MAEVETGFEAGGFVEILSGLEEGDAGDPEMREKRAACALALGLLTLGLFGCAAKAGTAPELLEPVGVRMDTEAVVRGEIAEWRALYVYLFVVPETTELFLTQSGEIQEICVQLGEEVGAGQVLLRLDVEAERERIAQIDQELAYLEADNALTLEQMQLDIDLCKYQMEDDNRDYKAGGEREALKENELRALEAALEQETARQYTYIYCSLRSGRRSPRAWRRASLPRRRAAASSTLRRWQTAPSRRAGRRSSCSRGRMPCSCAATT